MSKGYVVSLIANVILTVVILYINFSSGEYTGLMKEVDANNEIVTQEKKNTIKEERDIKGIAKENYNFVELDGCVVEVSTK